MRKDTTSLTDCNKCRLFYDYELISNRYALFNP